VVVDSVELSKIEIISDARDRRRRRHSGGLVISHEKQYGSLSEEKKGGHHHLSVARMTADLSGSSVSVTSTERGVTNRHHLGLKRATRTTLSLLLRLILLKLHRLCRLIQEG